MPPALPVFRAEASSPPRMIYLSGPMTGLPDYNYPAFHVAADYLRSAGHAVFNPAEWWRGPVDEFPVRRAFARYAQFICLEADAVVMLPGWKNSKGACAELLLAINCGLGVYEMEGEP
ncbi:MAG: hypothetical protein BGP07_03230 [Rhizobiales bacterium 63-22]|nr:MAG: hypothetical protein BGP07_03230 [Rhizobiales bacterium 63-22]